MKKETPATEPKTAPAEAELRDSPNWRCRVCDWENSGLRSICRNWKCRHRKDA